MKYGFVKVCAATPEVRVADVDFNTEKIIEAIKLGEKEGAQLIVFPELSVCGYTCGDLFFQTALIKAVDNGLKKICEATEGLKTLVFVGAPIAAGGKFYNSAVAINDGEILGIVPKTYIPNYGEFYERRYFASGADIGEQYATVAGQEDVYIDTDLIFRASNCPNFTVSAEICEDLWSPLSPSVIHTQAGANIIVNLSCSDELVGKAEYRKDLVKMQSSKLVCGYVYSNAGDGESSTDTTFAGGNLICENGALLVEGKPFENGLSFGEIDVEMLDRERQRTASAYTVPNIEVPHTELTFETDNGGEISRAFSKTPFIPESGLEERGELILTIQSKGLEKRLKHTGCKTAVIGVSGGLDSALALLVTHRAFKSLGLPAENIIAVTMPGFGTTSKTKNNSLELIKALGATAKTIPISKTVTAHFKDINHDPEKRDTTYENAQARMRTMVLMDIANELGGLVIGTGDLSELALGWATYNGDHMSMYGVNCSVPKTLVKHLVLCEAGKLGGKAGKVLNSIVNTEISPELLPPKADGTIAQKTEDLVGPYILHDFFLYYIVRFGFAPDKVYALACSAFKGDFDGETIKKWLKSFYKRFFSQQFKRSCSPDGVKVGSVALSPRGDWRMPSDAVANLWLKSIENL